MELMRQRCWQSPKSHWLPGHRRIQVAREAINNCGPATIVSYGEPATNQSTVVSEPSVAREQVLGRRAGSPIEMTSRAFFAMLIFGGVVVAVMWFAGLPSLTTFMPTLPGSGDRQELDASDNL